MPPQAHPERMIFARTADGMLLPVIDVTHPAFAIPDDPDSVRARNDAANEWFRKRVRPPNVLVRLLLRLTARRSPLVRALLLSDQGYLDSITTYVMKLGEDNLPPGFDSRIDRKIARAPHVALIRLRMQQIARLLAEALSEPLRRNPAAPLDFINIAGGPALDSVNAVILLKKMGDVLADRPIAIHVLDANQEGPAFGANAVAALKADTAPLHGLDVAFRHLTYDWNDTAMLARLTADLAARGAIMAASSEGGLFEYGSDAAITANLSTLAAARVPFVAGSVTSSSEIRKKMIAATRFRIYPRGIEGFEPLARQGGYLIGRHETAGVSEQVLLRLAPAV